MTIRTIPVRPAPGVRFRVAPDGTLLLQVNDDPTVDPQAWGPNQALAIFQHLCSEIHAQGSKWSEQATAPAAAIPVGSGPLTIKPPVILPGMGGAASPNTQTGLVGSTQPGIRPPPSPMQMSPGAQTNNGGVVGNTAPTYPGAPGALPQPAIMTPPLPPNMGGPSAFGVETSPQASSAAPNTQGGSHQGVPQGGSHQGVPQGGSHQGVPQGGSGAQRLARIEPIRAARPAVPAVETHVAKPGETNGVEITYERDAAGTIVRDERGKPITKAVVKGPIQVLPQPDILPPPPPPPAAAITPEMIRATQEAKELAASKGIAIPSSAQAPASADETHSP